MWPFGCRAGSGSIDRLAPLRSSWIELADLDLFALRAMAAQPLYVLAEISDDPVHAWRSGDREVINKLAEVELKRDGLRLPATLRADQTRPVSGDKGMVR